MIRNYYLFSACFVLAVVFESVISIKSTIPEYIHICHRSDPRVAACVKSAVLALKPKLIKGIPELNVPGIDPLHLDKIVIFDGIQNPGLKAELSNVEVRGAGNFEITKLKLDIDKLTYRVGVKIPYLQLHGDYSIDAKILASPIVGTGKYNANTTKVEGHAIIQGFLQDGHLKFRSIDFKILLGDFNLKLDPLSGASNSILSQAANEILNSNKADLIDLATPLIERKCSELFLTLANRITENLYYEEVFPL